MSRRTPRAAAALVVLLATLVLVAPTAPGGATPGQDPEQGTEGTPTIPSDDPAVGYPAIDDLVGCVRGSQRLLVVFLMDESASLKNNDPDDERVDSAQTALERLVALSEAGGPQVEVAFAAFANEYRLETDWTVADASSIAVLDGEIERFRELDSGIDTDFVQALNGARVALADRAAASTGIGQLPPCRAVLLFTDGGFDLAVRADAEAQERLGTTKPYAPGIQLTTEDAVAEAEKAGREAMCRPGGLADRLRVDNVTLLTVALSANVARRAQVPLAALTEGVADDYRCPRSEGEEVSRPQGAYLAAEDVDLLVERFDEVGTRLAGGNAVPGEVVVSSCAEEGCEEGARTVTLDPSIRRLHVLALGSSPDARLLVTDPDGEEVVIEGPGTSSVGAVSIAAARVGSDGLALDLDRPADGTWSGLWTITALAPPGADGGDPARLSLYVFSDLAAQLDGQVILERGAPLELEASYVDVEGLDLGATLLDASGVVRFRNLVTGGIDEVELQGPPTGPFTGTYETPADLTSNAVEVTLELRAVTRGGATILSQAPPAVRLVRRPEGSIQFTPPTLAMGQVVNDGTASGSLTVIGGDEDGCMWFGDVDAPDLPDGVDGVAVELENGELPTEQSCIPIAAGERRSLALLADPDGRATGTVAGSVTVFERVGDGEATATQVPITFDMVREVDAARRLVLAFGLLAAGLLAPMLLLVLINAVTARFQDLRSVRAAVVPVHLVDGKISRVDAGRLRPFALTDADFTSLADRGTNRRFAIGGVEFWARASRNPFGATVAMAAPEGGAEKLKGNEGARVELDLALAGSWVFMLDPDKTRRNAKGEADGEIIAFVAEGDLRPQTERMQPDIGDRLPAIASNLAGLVRSVKRTNRKAKQRRKAVASLAAAEAPAAEAEDLDLATEHGSDAEAATDATAATAAEGALDAGAATDATGSPDATVGGAASEQPTSSDDPPAAPPPMPVAPVGFGSVPVAPPPDAVDDDEPDEPGSGA